MYSFTYTWKLITLFLFTRRLGVLLCYANKPIAFYPCFPQGEGAKQPAQDMRLIVSDQNQTMFSRPFLYLTEHRPAE